MQMVSFIASIREFFLMKRDNNPDFNPHQTRFVIPKYQREYKWDRERVVTLFGDINNRDKFLGNIILNEVSDYYEIVDGQQRITTIVLFLVALFNRSKDTKGTALNEEQTKILEYLKREDHLILENESIGEYLRQDLNTINIEIEVQKDIYFQNDTFISLYNEIESELSSVKNTLSFLKKLLDCKILVLIGDTGGQQNESIEDIFLDINFKSQLLDVSDIFKGYCFKNYFSSNHDELKTLWTDIRKNTKEFEKFGYKDSKDTSEYLYYYLLSLPGSYEITANLSPHGKHYLEGKSNSETKKLLSNMVEYGKHVMKFYSKLTDETYTFVDICTDAESHKAESQNISVMRQMCRDIIRYPNAQYFKFPFFMFIHCLHGNTHYKDSLTYENLKKIVSNYYIYAFLFINDSTSKSKSSIDHTIFDALYDSQKNPQEIVDDIINALKNLRKTYLERYVQFRKFNLESSYALYSLIDNYDSQSNFLKELYTLPNYNKEHFLVHANSKMDVQWHDNGNSFTFSLKTLLGISEGRNFLGNQYRKLTSNYLILPAELNRTLGQLDVVEKISKIKNHYQSQSKRTPIHVEVFIQHIENINEYVKLQQIKGEKATQKEITDTYQAFIKTYFSEEQQQVLCKAIETALQMAFRTQATIQ